jgi:hypothetical protein
MRAPIIKLTIGDYLYRTPGVLESINITIEDDTSWEIASLEGEKQSRVVGQLPHYLNVAVSFKPIMDILPRRAQELNDIPALLANRNMIVDSEAKNESDTTRLRQESDRLQQQTRDLINQRAVTTELLSGLEESGFFNNSKLAFRTVTN